MKKIILFLLLCIIFSFSAKAFSYYDEEYYSYFTVKELKKDLEYSENQVFNKTYKKDNINDRLERLEVIVYGAVQTGNEALRIKKMRLAVTNISQGGKGLQYNILNNSNKNRQYSIGKEGLTMNLFNSAGNILRHTNYYKDNAFEKNLKHFTRNLYQYPCRQSHRLPPPRHHHHHRYIPPSSMNSNSNPLSDGDRESYYSMGTSVRILDD